MIKVVRLLRKDMPAPAFTDYNVIFIASEANPSEYKVLYKHEASHIFLEHFLRKPAEKYKDDLWRTALELEIARVIYTEDDLDIIKRPFSLLNKGVVPDTIPDLPPDIIIAEEIYKWLLENPDKQPKQPQCITIEVCEGCANKDTLPKENKIILSKDEIKKLIKKAKASTENKNIPDYKIKTIKTTKKPTLSSEIDYILRCKNIRKRSYSRESRRQVPNILLKGRKIIKKAPQIEVFVDRSGSFQGSRTKKSLEVIKKILQKYQTKIKNDFFYFSNGKLYEHDVPAQGGNPYPLVMKHLEVSRPKIAVILTDDDQEGDLKPLSHKHTTILCVPIGVSRTTIARYIGAKDVSVL